MREPFLFVALDGLCKKEKETLESAEQLLTVDGPFGFKVNLDYLLKYGIERVKSVQRFGRPVFTDLKMWNGTEIMKSVIEMLVEREVDYLNVHALADDLLSKAIQATEGSKTKVLALTVLTHYDTHYCQKHFGRSLREMVKHFALVALKAGCHGIILPGTNLEVVKDLETIKVVPGIRPKWYQDTRHEEEIEPKVAIEKGASVLVCGSPIMKSEKIGIDSVKALKLVLSEMKR